MSSRLRENFLRHAILAVDHSKDALISIVELDLSTNGFSFEQFINKNQHEIYHLHNSFRCCQCPNGYNPPRTSRILHGKQMDLLFDNTSKKPCHKSGRSGDYCCSTARPGLRTEILDLTTARCLLINFCQDVFWYSCLNQQGKTLEDFLNYHKHDIYHLWQYNTPCCECQALGYKFPNSRPILDQTHWNQMFNALKLPCLYHKKRPSPGSMHSICSVEAMSGITVTHLDPYLSKVILQNFCSLWQTVGTLVQIRNEDYGHATTCEMTDEEYNKSVNTIELSIMEIGRICNKETHFKKVIHEAKHGTHQKYKDSTIETLTRQDELNKSVTEKNIPIIQQSQTDKQKQIDQENLKDYLDRNQVDPAHLHLFAGTSEEFGKLLSTGTYESFENRVFLCGGCACGKSTLASVLIGSTTPLTWKSTDGLVIHFGRNGINLETYEMVPLTGEYEGQNVLTKVVLGNPNRSSNTSQNPDIHLDQHVSQSSTSANNPDSFVEAIFQDTSDSSKVYTSSDDCILESQVLTGTYTMESKIEKVASMSLPEMKKIEAWAVRDDILKEVKNGQYKMKIAPSDLVDFGGQQSYDMTHQLFIQHGGTFIVMFDGTRDFNDPLKEYPTGDVSNESIVRHWVNSILTYCVDDSDIMPMIVFAATHRDRLSEDKQMEKKYEFVKKVTEMFGTHERKKHFVFDPVFFINGRDKDDQEIKNLKNQLVSIARNQPSWGLRRPMIWVPIELLITNFKNKNINFILKTQLAEANKMNGDLALSDKQLDEFLLTQHELGKIMYFNKPELNNYIILYPPALVNILRSFITDEIFWPADETLRNILRRMTMTGKLYRKDLLELWQQKNVHDQIPDDDFKKFVIHVLVHLDVLVIPKRYQAKGDTQGNYFLVPCTVKHRMPMSFLKDKSFSERTISLVYTLHESSIPSALSFKLIGAISGIWPIKEINDCPLLYHSSAVLCVDRQSELRIMVEDKRIIVYLSHKLSKHFISPNIAASIQECLTLTLEAVLPLYHRSIGNCHRNLEVSNLFQIEIGEVCDKFPCIVPSSMAVKASHWVCDKGINHETKCSRLWFFDRTQTECPSNCKGVDKSVLTNTPTDKHLSRLAKQLSINSCKELVLYLGIEETEWEEIEYAYHKQPLIMKFMALKKLPSKSFYDFRKAQEDIKDGRHLLCKVFREDTGLVDIADIRLQEIPNNEVLKGLSKHLGNCAILLGIELEITISSIEETLTRHPRDMYLQIEDILGKWQSSKQPKPTIYRLMLAVERVYSGGLGYLKDIYLEENK